MFRVPGHQIEGMEQDRGQGVKAFDHTPRRSWQIHDQAFPSHPANPPGQRREDSAVQSADPDEFRKTRRLPVDDPSGGFRGHVSWTEPGPAGGDHQIGACGGKEKKLRDPVRIVGCHQWPVHLEAQAFQPFSGLRTGKILAPAGVNRVTHGDDHGGL